MLDGTNIIVNNEGQDIPQSWDIFSPQTEDCKLTNGHSFFQFKFSETLSTITSVGELIIEDWVFQNFFYDFTSFIGLANGHGRVKISGSTFKRFSNWGSIIRDKRELPVLDYTNKNSAIPSVTRNEYRATMVASNILRNKYFVYPSSECTDSNWASIVIKDSTFKDFNFLKPSIAYVPKISLSSEMRYQGIILNLEEFFGPVSVKGNTFDGLTFKFVNWEIREQQNDNSQGTLGGDASQTKALIYISVRNSPIEIFDNTFTDCNSLLGLLNIYRGYQYTGSILIHENMFSHNSAISGANILKLYLVTSKNYNEPLQDEDMICSNVKISNNEFEKNVGCYDSIGTIQAIWYHTSAMMGVYLSKENYIEPTAFIGSSLSKNALKDSVIDFATENIITLPSSMQQMDTNKFLLQHNTYIGNYAGQRAAISEFHNILRLFMDEETYEGNRGQYKEALHTFGTIPSIENAGKLRFLISLYSAYNINQYFDTSGSVSKVCSADNLSECQFYYPLGTLAISGSYSISMSEMSFFKNDYPEISLDYQTEYFSSPGICFSKWHGVLSIKSITFQDM